jgi:hypothetical protein
MGSDAPSEFQDKPEAQKKCSASSDWSTGS